MSNVFPTLLRPYGFRPYRSVGVKPFTIQDAEPWKAFVAPGDEIFTLKDSTRFLAVALKLGVCLRKTPKNFQNTSGPLIIKGEKTFL